MWASTFIEVVAIILLAFLLLRSYLKSKFIMLYPKHNDEDTKSIKSNVVAARRNPLLIMPYPKNNDEDTKSMKNNVVAARRNALVLTRAIQERDDRLKLVYTALKKADPLSPRFLQKNEKDESLFASLISFAIHTDDSAFQVELEQDMSRWGVKRSLYFWASVMKVYATKQRYRVALKLYDRILEDGVEPDCIMLSCLMNFAAELGETEKVEEFFELLKKKDIPSIKCYMTLIRVYSKKNDYQSAVQVMRDMCDNQVEPDNLVFNNVLATCVNAGQLQVASDLINEVIEKKEMLDIITFNTLIKGYALQGKYKEAYATLVRARDLGILPNDITYNSCMDAAIRASMVTEAWCLLDEMENVGIEADKYTCSILIKGLHQNGVKKRHEERENLMKRAMRLMAKLGKSSVKSLRESAKLHEVLFNSMLDACVALKDLGRLREVFQMMKDQGVQPTAVTYGTLIKAFGQAGDLSMCFKIWDEMKRRNISPTSVTFGCLMDACVNNGEMDRTMEVFEAMQQDNSIVVNTILYTTLIKGFAKLKQVDKAMAIYENMRKEKIACNSVTFNSLLDACARKNDPRMHSVLADMKNAGVVPDLITYSILIKANCEANCMDQAFLLFQKMKEHNFVPDEIVYNSLLKGCSQIDNAAAASDLFTEMTRHKVSPSNVTFSILIKLYGRCKMVDEAFGLFKQMRQQFNILPGVYVYTCLIQACIRNQQLKRAVEVFSEMVKNVIAPDAITYGALIHGCVYANKFELALEFVYRAYCIDQNDRNFSRIDGGMLPALMEYERVVNLQPEVVNTLLCAVIRKHKFQITEALTHLMNTLKIPILAKNQQKMKPGSVF
eukprot:GHVL01004617.1.p1 GENE.GHVL01004617.1~~GHVL01004617.1.p1  ORF type:complete len:839 (+),score=78.88 GHVL01004617.1:104-2620(+)